MFEVQALSIKRITERFNGFAQTHRREVHLVGVGLSDPQPDGFPDVAHSLRTETQQLCPDHVRRQRVDAGNHHPGLDRMAA
jgi:hypothetical protein